jgi:hypothetical protein
MITASMSAAFQQLPVIGVLAACGRFFFLDLRRSCGEVLESTSHTAVTLAMADRMRSLPRPPVPMTPMRTPARIAGADFGGGLRAGGG